MNLLLFFIRGLLIGKIPESEKLRWGNINNFDGKWDDRTVFMSKIIRSQGIIGDFGCGKMTLRMHLPKNCSYIPIDIFKRDESTIVCDFNKDKFPDIVIQIGFLSGLIEYIVDVPEFFHQLSKLNCEEVIFSYCTTNTIPSTIYRRKMGWVNNYSKERLSEIVSDYFRIQSDHFHSCNTIFRLGRK